MNRVLLGAALAMAAVCASVVACQTKAKPSANCKAVGAACSQLTDCCSYGCSASVCACNPVDGGVCATTADCCSPLVCVNNECLGDVKTDGGSCEPADAGCGATSDCCTNETCNLGALTDGGGICAACTGIGGTCGRNSDCCFNACSGGGGAVCQCVDKGQPCTGSDACCSGTCLGADAGGAANTCTCSALGQPCQGGGSCCAQPGIQCQPNPDGGMTLGTPNICCLNHNQACTSGADCCSGTCNGTKCQ